MEPIAAELIDHFDRQFATLDGVYERANEHAWASQNASTKGVWQWLYHALETAEFYLSEMPANEFGWRRRFGIDWENAQPKRVPSPEEMRAYQEDVRALVRKALGSRTDVDLTATETAAPWTGRLYLGKLLHLIRHTQQHIGDMNQILRINGCPAMEWH